MVLTSRFPFDFDLRFASFVGYCEPRHSGHVVMLVEHGLGIAAVVAMLSTTTVCWAWRLRLRFPSRQTD